MLSSRVEASGRASRAQAMASGLEPQRWASEWAR